MLCQPNVRGGCGLGVLSLVWWSTYVLLGDSRQQHAWVHTLVLPRAEGRLQPQEDSPGVGGILLVNFLT